MAAQWKIDVNRDPNDIPLQDMDPAHDDLFAANKVLPYFERLRREDPVHLSENGPYGRYWSITKYEDIMAVDTNHQVFSSDIRNGGIRLGGQRLEGDPDPLTHLPMFIMEDQPKHDEQRRAVQPMFTPQSLMNLEPLIRERAGLILDALPHGETFNWVREVSVELTGRTLATLFDVPQEDRHNLIHWSDTVERLGDPEYFETPEDGFKELWNCWEYFDGVWKERLSRKEPGSDLISMLAHSEATKNMSPNEYLGNMLLLIVGGNDTTRNSITGGVLALNQNPDQFRKLREDQSIIPNMVSEIIRWQSPVAHMCRTALEDTEIRGKKIRKWDKVAMWYVSGNRDEEKIARANEFLIDREGARQHLSFGFGIHRCIGNRVGEMQLRILWEEILKRFKSVEVAGDPKYLRSNFIRGITDLPVVVQPH
ncbi:MAG: cytochrome P450 [Rhizobiales bacterium]|nr:cytochrome P450 [Hyphomicrobiales bacterium]